ncbi:hypothetical protein KO519_20255 [Paraglaciecola agarilytica]|uniref:hypothetical protein n=1 Tax=Paraglaciecola chathamensis TaxID=368405 RepID=UPI001C0A4821|nr:hypothetical protein [Paraglaciecola agarilytica]MBU3020012.1 hypothetical protein [Paraglaciecola agarilytica]
MKKLILATTLALSSVSVNAAVISAGGISWDDDGLGAGGVANQANFQQWFTETPTSTNSGSDSTLDTADDYKFISSSSAVSVTEGDPADVGKELVGIGEFYSFSDGREPNNAPAFCDSGSCELTFAFGGLVVDSFVGLLPIFDVSEAWFNIYIDETPNFDGPGTSDTTLGSDAYTKYAEAQDGTLFAALSFDFFNLEGTIIGGEAEAGLSIRDIFGLGLDDVKEAWNYSDVSSDLGFTAGATFDTNNLYTRDGNGQTIGTPAQDVSAPSTVALFGLTLMCLVGATRRRRC